MDIREATGVLRARLQAKLPDGCRCPVCDQFAKTYKRKLNSGMALGLLVLYRESGFEYAHVERLIKPILTAPPSIRGDFAKLRYWGLVEKHPEQAGHWRVTGKGRAFVRCEISVPKHVLIYNDECLGFGDEETTIRGALGDRFDYAELMRTRGV